MIDSDPSVTEDGELPEITPDEEAEIDAEVERLQEENAFLKKAAAFFAASQDATSSSD